MSNLTELDLASLEKFEADLEDFIENVKKYCRKMESGIVFCQGEMRDDQSKTILEKSRMTIEHILTCIAPSALILEKVKTLIEKIKDTTVNV